MKKIIVGIIVIVLLGLLGYWVIGRGKNQQTQQTPQTQSTQQTQKYWTCGMHPSVRVSDEEYKKGKTNCPICNMPLIPVTQQTPQTQSTQEIQQEAKETYYCHDMKEGDTKHCFLLKAKAGEKLHCPICKGELKEATPEEVKNAIQEGNILSKVKLSHNQVELAGVVTVPIQKRHLIKEIRTVGKIAFDPELRVAQEEFLTALETRDKVKDSPDPDVIGRAQDLLEKSRFRLKLLGMSDEQITELEATKTAESSLVLPEDKVWVYAEIYEYELGWIKPGQEAKVMATAFPGEEFTGIIRSVNPVLDPKTRSARVRFQIDNPELKLKPEMFVDVKINAMYVSSDGSHEVLAVPREAVLDTGIRKLVYVDAGNGTFLGKEVVLGPEANVEIDDQTQIFYPVLKGLSEGEMIVTKGNFLIDSQSQLTGGMSVLWGGAQEIKQEGAAPSGGPAPVQTEHRH
ncbi:MAG: efflux RND transporter periplasmic adaptor subunit [Candidatus Omnitrophica bacterium]|nr:efflux RND transporter periplasmic adaptor subunit [Candidatus Omnitrophota bacterium]